MSDHDLPEDLISCKEAARLLGVHVATVYGYARDGKLPVWTRAGFRKYVSRAAVLGLYVPGAAPTPSRVTPHTTPAPSHRVPSHHEAIKQLRKAGFMKGGKT